MARTCKKKPPNPYRKEDKENRHRTHVEYRVRVKEKMAQGDYDNVPNFKGTSGWETH